MASPNQLRKGLRLLASFFILKKRNSRNLYQKTQLCFPEIQDGYQHLYNPAKFKFLIA